MIQTATGAKRLKGNLPAGSKVAHKTGCSGRNEAIGITAAVNDVGLFFYLMADIFSSACTLRIHGKIIKPMKVL